MKSSATHNESNKIYGGIALLIIGIIFLANNLGLDLPKWVISWPMLLIAIGFVSGAKHQFKKPGAIILMGIGGLFLLKKIFFISISVFPVLLIGAGLWMIFKTKLGVSIKHNNNF